MVPHKEIQPEKNSQVDSTILRKNKKEQGATVEIYLRETWKMADDREQGSNTSTKTVFAVCHIRQGMQLYIKEKENSHCHKGPKIPSFSFTEYVVVKASEFL